MRLFPKVMPRGEAVYNHKLTDDAVMEIRSTAWRYGVGKALAEKFRVSPSLVSLVKLGKTWTRQTQR